MELKMINLENDRAKKRELAVIINLSLRLERRFAHLYRKLFNKYADKVKRVYIDIGRFAINEELTTLREELKILLLRQYKIVTDVFGKRTLRAFAERKDNENTFRAAVESWMINEVGEQIKRIDDTTKLLIREAIDKAEREGLGVEEIGRRIRDSIGGDMSRYRSNLIARTETHNAMTFANHAAAESTGGITLKEWVSAEDSRTRDSHRSLDGKKIPMNEPFRTSEGIIINRPGDPNAPAKETINCRCVLMYHEA